jgi:hypothetical protein
MAITPLRLLDGLGATRDHLAGRLPAMIADAGFIGSARPVASCSASSATIELPARRFSEVRRRGARNHAA